MTHSLFAKIFLWFWAAIAAVILSMFIITVVGGLEPLYRRCSGAEWRAMLLRLGVAVASAGLLCWMIARHITAPIRSLQDAAGRIAQGDLAVRATPTIPPRNDEIADLARDFDRMADRVSSLLRKQQELLGDISHELRSPLARLSVSLELTRRGDAEGTERMQADLDRLDRLIEQILTLTRLQLKESGKLETAVDLRAILESVAEDTSFEGKNAEKYVVIAHADDCQVMGDASLLRSCVENVVRNAIRYTPPQTAVELALDCSGDPTSTACLTVRDQGPGVPAQALPRLFEPFFRVSEARDRATGGSGLGLSIAQKVAKVHGGTISARNLDNGGLIVELRLPIRKSLMI